MVNSQMKHSLYLQGMWQVTTQSRKSMKFWADLVGKEQTRTLVICSDQVRFLFQAPRTHVFLLRGASVPYSGHSHRTHRV